MGHLQWIRPDHQEFHPHSHWYPWGMVSFYYLNKAMLCLSIWKMSWWLFWALFTGWLISLHTIMIWAISHHARRSVFSRGCITSGRGKGPRTEAEVDASFLTGARSCQWRAWAFYGSTQVKTWSSPWYTLPSGHPTIGSSWITFSTFHQHGDYFININQMLLMQLCNGVKIIYLLFFLLLEW